MTTFFGVAPSGGQMSAQAMKVWWLSYAEDREDGPSKGVVIVEGETFLAAIVESHRLKLNPGGQVSGLEIPPEVTVYGAEYRNRFYPPAEARELAKFQ